MLRRQGKIWYLAIGSSISLSLLIPASTVGLGVHAALPTSMLLFGLEHSFFASTFPSLHISGFLSLILGLVPCLALDFLTPLEFSMLVGLLGGATLSARRVMVEERHKYFSERLTAAKKKKKKKKNMDRSKINKSSTRLAAECTKAQDIQCKHVLWISCTQRRN